jgi:hypothetical protein
MKLTDKELILYYFANQYQAKSSDFTIRDLLASFTFIKYLIPMDEIDKICNLFLKKRVFIEKAQSPLTYTISKEIKIDAILNSEDLKEFMINNYKDIINRIPLAEFDRLDKKRAENPIIASFSGLLVPSMHDWWAGVLEMSIKYNNVLERNGSIKNFIDYIGQAFELNKYYIENIDVAQQSWHEKGYAYFRAEIDRITPWKNIEPCIIIIRADSYIKNQQTINEIENKKRLNQVIIFIPIILGEIDETLKTILVNTQNKAFLTPLDLKDIALKKSMKDAFREIIRKRIELHLISPYQVQGFVPPGFFFGRKNEIDMILTHKTANYAIYGNRRVGKTSLLKKLEDIYRKDVNHKVIYIDCKKGIYHQSELIKELCDDLNFPLCESATDLAKLIGNMNSKITLLLDEIDDLLMNENPNEIFGVFRALSNTGVLRVIFAGYIYLYKLSMDLNSPMYNFANPIKLGFLSETHAIELAQNPMLSLGVQYEEGISTVKRLLFYSSYNPDLIQMMCNQLVLILDKEHRRIIEHNDIINVFNGNEFQEHVDGIFFDNLKPLEQLIILQNLLVEPFGENLIFNKLEEAGLGLPFDEILNALQNLVLMFIFEKVGTKYKYTYERFPGIFKKRHDPDLFIPRLIKQIQNKTITK